MVLKLEEGEEEEKEEENAKITNKTFIGFEPSPRRLDWDQNHVLSLLFEGRTYSGLVWWPTLSSSRSG